MKRRAVTISTRTRAVALAAAAVAGLAQPLSAQDRPEGFSVGLGVAAGTGLFVGGDGEVGALPIIRYESDAFSFGLPDGLRVTLFDQGRLRLSGVVSPRFSGIDVSDSPLLSSFDRDITADGGVQLQFALAERTDLTVRAVTELTDEHGGSQLSASVSHALPLGLLPLRVGAGVAWKSEELATYEFGVTAADAAVSTFAAYNPGDVIVPHLSIGTTIPINDRTSVIANLRAEFLPDEISNSPIIDEDVAVGAFLGISYRF